MKHIWKVEAHVVFLLHIEAIKWWGTWFFWFLTEFAHARTMLNLSRSVTDAINLMYPARWREPCLNCPGYSLLMFPVAYFKFNVTKRTLKMVLLSFVAWFSLETLLENCLFVLPVYLECNLLVLYWCIPKILIMIFFSSGFYLSASKYSLNLSWMDLNAATAIFQNVILWACL